MRNDKQERMLKLIWDFRGPDALQTARHHAHHLEEYINLHKLSLDITGAEQVRAEHALAFMVVRENEMPAVRDSLRPHRGQLYKE